MVDGSSLKVDPHNVIIGPENTFWSFCERPFYTGLTVQPLVLFSMNYKSKVYAILYLLLTAISSKRI